MIEVMMSIKEADRLGVMRQIDKKVLTIRQASEQLEVSLRQAKRIRKRYLREGEKGLISKKRGQRNNNAISKDIKDKAINLIKTQYPDFGLTLVSEKLKERDGIELSDETLRKWMVEEGIWKVKKKKKTRVFQRRERRSRFGELLQGDGSPHDWLVWFSQAYAMRTQVKSCEQKHEFFISNFLKSFIFLYKENSIVLFIFLISKSSC